MAQQVEFSLKPQQRGFHLITDEVVRNLPTLPKTGLLNLFIKHTSCALSICENWDPSVRADMETIYDRLVPENAPYYEHTLEGSDDMPAHAKSIITGVSINIPLPTVGLTSALGKAFISVSSATTAEADE